MRCSYYKTSSKSTSSNSAVNILNYRILQDLNKHNWLLKKLKWGIKTNDTNHKHAMDIQRRELTNFLKFNNVELTIASKRSSNGDAADTLTSIPVSLPLKHCNNMNVRDTGNNNPANDHSVTDNKALDPNDEEDSCNEITKEFRKALQVSEASARPGIRENKTEIVTKLNDNKQGVKKNDFNYVSMKNGFIIERKGFIKHNLPINAPPERTKYVYKNSEPSTSGILPAFNNKPTFRNMESQTETVIIINQNYKEMIDFITSNNITMDNLREIVNNNEKKNGETDSGIDNNNNNTNGIMRNNIMQVLEACSLYNKEIIAYNSKVAKNVSESERIIERIKLTYLRENFKKIFGEMFENLAKSLKFDDNNLDVKLPDIVPKKYTLRKRRVSMAIDSPQELLNNADSGNDCIPEQVPMAKKPLRNHRKSPKATASAIATYQPVPYGQLQQTTKVVQVETNYCNAHVPRVDYMEQQYPSPRHRVQNDHVTPFYNQGPRMMQPYALQFAREQQVPPHYPGNIGNSWNYPFSCPNITHNAMYNTTYMNGVRMSTQVMPTPQQQNYLHMQVETNNVHSRPDTPWNKHMEPNCQI